MSKYKVGDIVCLHSLERLEYMEGADLISSYYTDYYGEYFGNNVPITIFEEQDAEGDYYVMLPNGECEWIESTWIKEKLGEDKPIPKIEKKQSPTMRLIRR